MLYVYIYIIYIYYGIAPLMGLTNYGCELFTKWEEPPGRSPGNQQQSSPVALAGSEPWNQRDVGIGYAGTGNHDVSQSCDKNQHAMDKRLYKRNSRFNMIQQDSQWFMRLFNSCV